MFGDCWVVLCVLLVLLGGRVESDPNYQGCVSDVAKGQPYCDVSKSFEDRVASLLSSLSLDEKISLLSPDNQYDTCPIVMSDIPRIGMPRYMWLVETNTGVSSACLGPDQCATTFIGPTGLGATWNRTLWRAKGDVISTEMRAFSNANGYRGIGSQPFGFYLIGLTGYGPNMNIIRDPRFGRNSELPSEDPYLTGSYAVEYIRGIEQKDAQGYYKMRAYLKHFTAYSVETNRGHDTHNISAFDFWDTYLPAYGMAFVEGNASGVMCSYNGENGVPSCANGWLLNEVIRKRWNSPDAVVTTDCGAVTNLLGPPAHAQYPEYASAWSINNGTDIEAGSSLWRANLASAIAKGLSSEATVDAALRRALLQHFSLGRFDPIERVSWTNIPASTINSTAHQQLNYEAALQSFVLLKNSPSILPLPNDRTIAVLGPQAVARFGLLSDYYGDFVCWADNERPNNKSFDCITNIAEAVSQVNQGKTLVEMGVDINSQRTNGIQAALDAATAADIVVLVVGTDNTIEHEGIDRSSTTLPGLQQSFAQKVLAVGKPTVLVLVNGGIVSLDGLIEGPSAIVEAFFPSMQGARALAAALFGKENRWGKLPVTIYPADYINQVDLFNFDMSKYPGRTYRYYQNLALFPFGHGLSLTTFELSCDEIKVGAQYTCMVSNVGSLDGDEVVQVYHSVGVDISGKVNHPVPIRHLVGFERVSVPKGLSKTIEFDIDGSAFQLTNESGDKVTYHGQHYLTFSKGNGPDIVFSIIL